MHRAARNPDPAGLRRLLCQHGLSATSYSKVYKTPLHDACNAGHAANAALLLEHKADAAVHKGNGWTPLMFAAKAGSGPTIALLVEHRADLEAQNREQSTALTLATRAGQSGAVGQLLQARASVRVVCSASDCVLVCSTLVCSSVVSVSVRVCSSVGTYVSTRMYTCTRSSANEGAHVGVLRRLSQPHVCAHHRVMSVAPKPIRPVPATCPPSSVCVVRSRILYAHVYILVLCRPTSARTLSAPHCTLPSPAGTLAACGRCWVARRTCWRATTWAPPFCTSAPTTAAWTHCT